MAAIFAEISVLSPKQDILTTPSEAQKTLWKRDRKNVRTKRKVQEL